MRRLVDGTCGVEIIMEPSLFAAVECALRRLRVVFIFLAMLISLVEQRNLTLAQKTRHVVAPWL